MSRRRRKSFQPLVHGVSYARGRRELVVFGVVYLLYDASRWVFAGGSPTAEEHARWIIDPERSMHVAVERSLQRTFAAGPAAWVLSIVYLAAQLVELPGSLIWLYRRSPAAARLDPADRPILAMRLAGSHPRRSARRSSCPSAPSATAWRRSSPGWSPIGTAH